MPTKEEIITKFSALADLLIFIEKTDGLQVKPRKFLGLDNFAKVAAVTRNLGGEYVSAGKESHFKIPYGSNQPPQNQPSTFTPTDQLALTAHFDRIINEIEALKKEVEAMLKK